MLTVQRASVFSFFAVYVSAVSGGLASAGDYVCLASAGQCRGACTYQSSCALGQTPPHVLTSAPPVQAPVAAPVASPSVPTESQPLPTLASATDNTKLETARKAAPATGASQYQCPYLVSRTTTETPVGNGSLQADSSSNPIFIADESADLLRFPPVPAGGFANIAEAIESVERWSATRTVVRRDQSTSSDRSAGDPR